MIRDPLKYLWDASEVAAAITEFTQGKTAAEYAESDLLRSAVERQFEIIGEALAQFEKTDPTIAGRIPNLRSIVGFRNILVHGYAIVDDDIVWRIVQEDLPRLRQAIDQLLTAEKPRGQ
jgi:uncharacterized protein with HEPN domain